ncbi:hypothetical protein D9758_016999 [Tetrapyrgos nigripes]|uniref:DUF6534 domain-containing protein n=1 Tax=Tetrapyrgos nigripes TaxID=182062 RepID=A0A8H5FDL7_9AGAR|nr:hypothetical protein D9758_016999 [Tetrapyrgos nigripes]
MLYAIRYFRRYPADKIPVKVAVLLAVVCDTLIAVAGPTPISCIASGISGAIMQIFMLNRYWVLTGQKFIVITIGHIILTSVASALYVTIRIIVLPHEAGRNQEIVTGVILIRRLMALTLKSGSFTAITAILILATFVGDLHSNIGLIFSYNISHVYSLTLLYNLNIRQKLRNVQVEHTRG